MTRMATLLVSALAAWQAKAPAPQALTEGRQDSAVRLVIYEDLQCSDCATFRKMMDEHLLSRYADKVAFIHRDFPLAKHAWARKAAIAARFFGELKPDLGLQFRRYVLEHLREIREANFDERLAEFARQNEIDARKAVTALSDARLAELVEKDVQDGVARGVAKTPTVFVNGKPFIEHFSVEEISHGIEDALAERR